MKKHLLSLFAMASMLFASSCSQEEIISQSTGDEVKVTFTTEFRNDVKSRAVGEDTGCIDQLIFAVYNEKGENLKALNQTLYENSFSEHPKHPEKKVATIDVVLVKGQTYSFAFWAQDKDYTAYQFDPSTAEVTINYDQLANKREADAFFMGIEDYTVTGTFKKDVTLKRPFAQVNFLTTNEDLNKAKAADFIPTESKILVKNVAKKLNVLDGSVSGKDDAEVTFDYSALLETEPGQLEKTNIEAVREDLMYLATAYFLPQEPVTSTTITASMSVKGTGVNSNNVKALVELTAPDITAQRNYRTNIYGDLLTSNGKFTVIIDPNEEGNTDVKSTEFTETYESLQGALNENVVKTEALTYNVESSTSGTSGDVAISIPADTQASSLTFSFDNSIAGAEINISNEGQGNYAKPVVIEVPEGVSLNQIEVNLPNAHVTLKQGNYTEVISSTSNTTLVVSEGTIIENLTVVKGYVRISQGAKIKNIVRSEENEDAFTYVIYEDSVPTEVNADKQIIYVSVAEFELISAAENGGEVTLSSNITLTKSLEIAPTAITTIDLNGHTISQEKECTASYEMINNKGILTIKDTKGNGKISFKDTSAGDPSFSWGSYTIRNEGTLTIENGTIEHLGEQKFATHMICAIFQYSGSTIINGGTISTPNYRSARLWKGDMTINDGTFDGQLWVQAVDNSAALTINGGSFEPNGNDGSSVFVGNETYNVIFSVTGGTFNTKIGCSDANKLAGSITGGTFTKEAKENTNSDLIAVGYDFEKQNDETWAVVKGIEAMIGEQGYKTLQAALDAVKNGETIILQSDVKVTEPAYGQNALNHDRAVSFTIDLNGKTISADTGNSVFRFNITNCGATSDVTVTLKNGTITSGDKTWCTVMAAGHSADVKAVLELEDLTINASKAGDLAVKAWDNAVVKAKNVTVNATKCAGGFYAVGGEIVLANCTVNQEGLHTAPYMSMAVAVSNGGKLTVNSGTYTTEPTAASEGYNQGTSHGSWCAGVMNSGGELIINGGTFANGNFGDDALATAARGLIFGDTASKIEINDGTFNALKSIIDYQNNLGVQPNPNIVIKGGNFSANPAVVTSYGGVEFAEGKAPVQGANGRWTLMDAVMDEAGLKAAFAKGGDILLGADITVSETLALAEGKTAILNLNGKTLSHAEESTKYAINNLGTLTITGNGTVNARGIYNGYDAGGNNVATAKLTIKNGTFNAKGTDGGAAVFNYGICDINGGEFTSIGGYSLNNQSGSSMTIADGVTANNGVYASNATLEINGGDIDGNRSGCHVVYAWNTQLTINEGDFYNYNSGNATIMVAGTSKAIINNGTFGIKDGRIPGNGNTWTSCLTDCANTATMTVNNGTFNGGFRVQAGTTMTINGGSFNDCYGSNYNIYGTAVVKGGTYTDIAAQAFAKKYIAEGYEMNANGEVVAK